MLGQKAPVVFNLPPGPFAALRADSGEAADSIFSLPGGKLVYKQGWIA
jgi:hypothetical protein